MRLRKWFKAHMTIAVILGGGLAILVILTIAILTILFSSVSQECDSSDSTATATTATTGGSGGAWTQVGSSAYNNAKQIFDYLTQKKGFSGAGAAGAVAVAKRESNFKPTIPNTGGGVVGIFQWSGWSNSVNGDRIHAGGIIKSEADLIMEKELELTGYELDHGYSKVKTSVGRATDPSKAALNWSADYEGVSLGDGQTKASQIEADAQTAYQLFNGASIAANDSLLGGVTNTATTGTASAGDDSSSSCSTTSSTSSGTWGWPFDSVKSIQDAFKKLDSPTSEQAYGKSPQRSGDFHDGWDFGSAKYGTGSTIKAVHDGTVYKIEHKNGYWMVDVKSSDGYYEVYQEAFASRSDIAVSEGQSIKVGDKIGMLTDSHLHLGISKTEIGKANAYWNVDNGTWLNPVRLIAGQGDTTTDDYGKSAP